MILLLFFMVLVFEIITVDDMFKIYKKINYIYIHTRQHHQIYLCPF